MEHLHGAKDDPVVVLCSHHGEVVITGRLAVHARATHHVFAVGGWTHSPVNCPICEEEVKIRTMRDYEPRECTECGCVIDPLPGDESLICNCEPEPEDV